MPLDMGQLGGDQQQQGVHLTYSLLNCETFYTLCYESYTREKNSGHDNLDLGGLRSQTIDCNFSLVKKLDFATDSAGCKMSSANGHEYLTICSQEILLHGK